MLIRTLAIPVPIIVLIGCFIFYFVLGEEILLKLASKLNSNLVNASAWLKNTESHLQKEEGMLAIFYRSPYNIVLYYIMSFKEKTIVVDVTSPLACKNIVVLYAMSAFT